MAQEFVVRANELFAQHPDKVFDAIIDMTKSGVSDYGGVKVYRTFLRDQRLGRLAFVMSDRVITQLVKLAAQGRKSETRFFNSVEEAREWLQHS